MVFFRAACAILVFATLPAAAQHVPTQSSSSKPHAHLNAPSDPGEVREGVYRNPTFGFSYKLPFGWVERTEQMRQDSSGSKSLVLLSAFERPPEAAGDTVNSAVLIAAESVSSYPGLKAEQDYFRPLTEVATSRCYIVAHEHHEVQRVNSRIARTGISTRCSRRP